MAGKSQVAASPSGIGRMVRYPCITSKPMSSGMCRRVCLTAISCSLRAATGVKVLSTPPTRPFAILASTPSLTTGPVTVKPTDTRLSWPIFSSGVICCISLLMNCCILASGGGKGVFWAVACRLAKPRAPSRAVRRKEKKRSMDN
jgi:hypothetical protein